MRPIGRKRFEHPAVVFLLAFIATSLSVGAWSLATPLGAAPDEPEHLIQAAAVVRGQFDGPQVPVHYGPLLVGKMGVVRVPAWVTDVTDPQGLSLDSPICPSARSCHIGPPLGLTSMNTIRSATQFSNYLPVYYFVVGWPTLLSSGTGALYGVRIVEVLLNSALIAFGLYLLARYNRRRALLGALIALTPTVLFFGSVVNSSGTEIAAGFAAWCGGLCIVAAEEIPPSLVISTTMAFIALVLTRPTSWVSALVILGVLGTLAGWNRCRELVTLRTLWTGITLAIAVAIGFLVVAGTPNLLGFGEHRDLAGKVWLTLRLMGGQLHQTIAVFGWLNIVAPTWVTVIWVVAVVGVIAYALAPSHRARRALPLLAVAIFAYPFIFEATQLSSVGPYWQGRYWLPLAVGLPLIAAATMPALRRSGVLVIASLLAVAQLGAFFCGLDAYEGHPVRPGASTRWYPPGGEALTITLFVLGQLSLVGFVMWQSLERRTPSLTTPAGHQS